MAVQAKLHISAVEYSLSSESEFEPLNRLKNSSCASFSFNGNFCAFAQSNHITLWDARSSLYPMCKLTPNTTKQSACIDLFWSPKNSLLGCLQLINNVPSTYQSLLTIFCVRSSKILFEMK